MAEVSLQRVVKRFGPISIINGISLDVERGEFCVFVGPSGCGKSTLLRMIAGLEDISEGQLFIGGREMTQVAPANRGIAMVFQSYALYPHMTVAENISFGLRMANAPKADIARRVQQAATLLELGPLLDRRPSQLSGGQRQRVAIGRAIVREPAVFLFDEPLSNLDAALRLQTRVEILKLHQQLGATMIYVTHDQVEAMTMADKIVVLQAGRIEQVGSPLDLYHKPCNLFVARFIGSPKMNIFATRIDRVEDGMAHLLLPGDVGLALPTRGSAIAPGEVLLGIRPEHVTFAPVAAAITGSVQLAEHLGSETILHVGIAGGEVVLARADGLSMARHGDTVALGIVPEACHLFSLDGQALLNGSLLA